MTTTILFKKQGNFKVIFLAIHADVFTVKFYRIKPFTIFSKKIQIEINASSLTLTQPRIFVQLNEYISH